MYKLEIKPLAGAGGTGTEPTKPIPRIFEAIN